MAKKTVAIKKIFRLDDFQLELKILKELNYPFLVSSIKIDRIFSLTITTYQKKKGEAIGLLSRRF